MTKTYSLAPLKNKNCSFAHMFPCGGLRGGPFSAGLRAECDWRTPAVSRRGRRTSRSHLSTAAEIREDPPDGCCSHSEPWQRITQVLVSPPFKKKTKTHLFEPTQFPPPHRRQCTSAARQQRAKQTETGREQTSATAVLKTVEPLGAALRVHKN